jgi:hypothetical protein
MSTDKKPWIRPQLIVLGRGRPEEAVLITCKGQEIGQGAGPTGSKCAPEGAGWCKNQGTS